ncbi:Alpha- and gamma-adaptin-binding protein p34 [Acipenser ruthenus]|uniref:Alpha-and gamma-adaptin-binding protein p34 n=1 Tax=Acipenser ruthenus TaxID=7906 RepID=A0A444V691_ACIRT|nr:Alpha- and gamma-adaptin-binding protein p34 [Acipenser ruthenus]
MLDMDIQELASLTTGDADVENFERLFSKLKEMKEIIAGDGLLGPSSQTGEVRWYPWTINNKYYTADICLCAVPNRFLVTSEIAEGVQAFIVYFDSNTKSGLDGVSLWLPLAEDWSPEVLILVCDRVSENDDFPESTGIKRIVQALNANVWSNMEMKDGMFTD